MSSPPDSTKAGKGRNLKAKTIKNSSPEEYTPEQETSEPDNGSESQQPVELKPSEPFWEKTRIGSFGPVPVNFIVSEEYWKPFTQYILLPLNHGDYGRFSEYVERLSSAVRISPGSLKEIDDKRFWYEGFPQNFRIIPLYPVEEKGNFTRFLVIAVFPISQPPDLLLRTTIENIFDKLPDTTSPDSPKNLSVILTPYFSDFENEKVAAILSALRTQAGQGSGKIRLSEIIFITAEDKFIGIIYNYFNLKSQPLEGDVVSEIDRLNFEIEASALADVLALRDMTPPISLAVMGGWGSGKSSVMRLIQKRMRAIRSEGLLPEQAWLINETDDKEKLSPYVGHIYQIELNAWDYAKSNLWASLMHRIFYCLNDQMVKEKLIAEFLAGDQEGPTAFQDAYRLTSPLWEALTMKEKDLRIILDKLESDDERKFLEELNNQDETVSYLWESLKKSKEDLGDKLKETRKSIAATKIKLYNANAHLDRLVEKKITGLASASKIILPIREKVKQLLGDLGNEFFTRAEAQISKSQEKAFEKIELNKVFDFSLYQKIKFNKYEWAGFILFTVISFGVPYLVDWGKDELPGIILGILTFAAGIIRNYMKFHSTLKSCYEEYTTHLEKVKNEMMIDRDVIRQKVISKLSRKKVDDPSLLSILNIPEQEEELSLLIAREKRQKELYGITAEYETLTEFLQARLSEGSYEKELGLMHQVKKDLEFLTDGLIGKNELFPRGPARVVLFIDDLDRCPPQRVVEVLEATQLLLRTELFVVVMAIDVRYIVKALEKYYEKILVRGGRPSALDYIEKIIQIPYRVRPINPGTMGNFLRWQMAVEITGNTVSQGTSGIGGAGAGPAGPTPGASGSGPKPVKYPVFTLNKIKFTEDEAQAWETCCKEVQELTPREIKRLVNVAKIMKLVWYREGAQPPLEVQKAIYLLLALSERYPDLMREILSELSQKTLSHDTSKSFKLLFKEHQILKHDAFLVKELASLNQIVSGSSLIPDHFSLGSIDSKTLDLVRCFCFVGDVGYDPVDESLNQNELIQHQNDQDHSRKQKKK